jgi:hypothetical protein
MSQAQKRPKPVASEVSENAAPLPRTVTAEQIAVRAYQIYQERGDGPGSDVEDWLEAERQLNQAVD